jgi:hypothetical protein
MSREDCVATRSKLFLSRLDELAGLNRRD